MSGHADPPSKTGTDLRSDPLFILGAERSGSTWLANIVDAHPSTTMLMEPFSRLVRAFPDFPDRMVPLDRANRFLHRHVEEGFSELLSYKYRYGYRAGGSQLSRQLAFSGIYPVSDWTSKLLKKLGLSRPLAHVRFKNLNKNRVENRFLNRLSKNETPRVLAVKELRLNLKVGLLSDLWPEASVLVIVRNPVSQIDSMLRLIGEGSLHELRRAFYVVLETGPTSKQPGMAEALETLDPDSLLDRAVGYWFLNYGSLIAQLERSALEAEIVRHEDLCEEPEATAERALATAGLTSTPQVFSFLDWSTRDSSGSTTVMDTRRPSSRYHIEALGRVSEDRRDRIIAAAEPFWTIVPTPLRSYREWLDRHLAL